MVPLTCFSAAGSGNALVSALVQVVLVLVEHLMLLRRPYGCSCSWVLLAYGTLFNSWLPNAMEGPTGAVLALVI